MNYVKASITVMMMLAIVIVMTSCSSSSKVGETPISTNTSGMELPTTFGTEDTSGRSVLAVYDVVIDPIAKTFVMTPMERSGAYHFPLSIHFPNVLQIVNFGFIPNLWADIKLTHPFPGSGINGFDARVIAILPANSGVSFNYPTLNAFGNNEVIVDPDGYTNLFDNLGGSIAGNTNPFRAYFKDESFRVWSNIGLTSEIQRWDMNLSGFGGPLVFKLVVDVSSNYPQAPIPIIDNAIEPVGASIVVENGLTNLGGNAEIIVTLNFWQSSNNIACSVEAPDLFDGLVELSLVGSGPEPFTWIMQGIISNSLHAPAGQYSILVSGWNKTNESLFYFKEALAEVSLQKFVLTSNFYPWDIVETNCGCQDEFGDEYRMADWGEIVLFVDEFGFDEFFVQSGMAYPGLNGWVTRGGQHFYSGNRHYFAERHDGVVPPGWLVHAELGGHIIDLGSWYMTIPTLCYHP